MKTLTITADATYKWHDLFVLEVLQWIATTYTVDLPNLTAHILDHNSIVITDTDANKIVPHTINPLGDNGYGLRVLAQTLKVDLGAVVTNTPYSVTFVVTFAVTPTTPDNNGTSDNSPANLTFYPRPAGLPEGRNGAIQEKGTTLYLTTPRQDQVFNNTVLLLLTNTLANAPPVTYKIKYLDTDIVGIYPTLIQEIEKNSLIITQGRWHIGVQLEKIV